MASVYEKRGTWYLRYKNERGRWTAQASSAVTKTEARRLAEDFQRKAERIRLGLEPAMVVTGDRTVGDIVSWWLETVWIGRPSYPKAKSAISAHILKAPFAAKRPQDVTPAEIEHYLEAKQRVPGKKGKPLGAQSLNHLREFMRRAFKAAIGERQMPGPNPIDSVRRWVVPKRLPDFLRFHEVPLVLAAVRSRWRDVFATAIYAGLRKGELFGLRKTDVDLEIGVIMVRRSYDRVTTKGKRSDAIPVAAELRPYLEHALRISPSDLVFPREDGTMHAETTQLEMVLRRALRKAGLTIGYRHKCRKPGCGYVEAAADPGLRDCPRHKKNRRLWVALRCPADPLPRPPPHDGQPPHYARREHAVRAADHAHSDPRMTERYTHLDPAYLHGEMDALMRFQPAPVAPQAAEPTVLAATAGAPPPRAAERESAPFVTRLLPEAPEGTSAPVDGITSSVGIPDVTGGAGYRVRTGDIQLGKQPGWDEQGVAGGSSALQVGEKIRSDGAPRSQESRPLAPIRSPFVTRLLPGSGDHAARLAVLQGGRDGLLSVREAAEQLGLCTATVYGLCADGALAHVRILNAIRIAPVDLAAFIADRRVAAPPKK